MLPSVEEINVLRQARSRLRSDLMIKRGKYTLMGWLPECAVCQLPVRHPILHQVIVTENDVSEQPEDIKISTLVPENCVLVHHNGCYEKVYTDEGRTKCVKHLVKIEGLQKIQAWLERENKIRVGQLQDMYKVKHESNLAI